MIVIEIITSDELVQLWRDVPSRRQAEDPLRPQDAARIWARYIRGGGS